MSERQMAPSDPDLYEAAKESPAIADLDGLERAGDRFEVLFEAWCEMVSHSVRVRRQPHP